MVGFGGPGTLQAGKLLEIPGLKAGLVPPDPGNVSAFGLLTVDVKNDFVLTAVQRDDALDLDRLNASYLEMEQRARRALSNEGFSEAEMRLVRSADLRYFGQAWGVRVEVPAGPRHRILADLAMARCPDAHRQ